MRLGFHYHIPAYLKGGKIITMSLQGLFIDSLAPHCKKVTLFLHSPKKSEMYTMDYEIASSNVELVDLGVHSAVPVRLLRAPFISNKINKSLPEIDILLMRAPTPVLPVITRQIRKKKKFSYLIVGETVEHVDNLAQPGWRKKLIKLYSIWNEERQKAYAKDALVFFNSAVLQKKYGNNVGKSVLVRTTTLKKSDFFVREDTCLNPVYELLYTGRIERGKGLLDIVEAVGNLNQQGINSRLNIVGWADDDTPAAIKKLAEELGVSDKVIFHGKKKVGDELFSFYRKADIFILASQIGEGFPRTITEALANSVPVISTDVGSIGFFHRHKYDIMFVEQKNALDITEKVKEIITNGELRRSLIKNGLKTVAEVTLDVQAEKICKELKEYISE